MQELNDRQLSAATAGDGPLVIVAGPGTGKTKTLAARIDHLLSTGRAKPSQILALTFTKKAAQELQQRVKRKGPTITTFHALCYELLDKEQQFISEPARLQLIKKLPKPADLRGLTARELGLKLSLAKNLASQDSAIQKLLKAYNKALHDQQLIDYDDLLVMAKEALEQDDAARKAWQARFTYILVDEFQDTNKLQYELLRLLAGHQNILVIGDPQQSIYGFRGSSGDIFNQFMADHPGHTAISLTTNYRSVPQVVRLANALFGEAPDLTANNTQDGSVRAVQVFNEYSEANWVINEIQRAIGGGDMLRAVSDDERSGHKTLRDFAILYRSRSAAAAMQKAVEASGLPYQIVGDGSPYDMPEVQALIALLRAEVDGRLPELEGYSAAEVKAVRDVLDQTKQAVPSKVAQKLISILGFDATPELAQFVNTLVRFKDIASAIAYFDDIAERGFYDQSADVVTLLTIHASKGLEFGHVFLLAAEEGILPLGRSQGPASDRGEERRLFYVAATRAKQNLDILHTKTRGGQPAVLSRFAAEVPDAVLAKTIDSNVEADQKRAVKRAIKRSQQSLF